MRRLKIHLTKFCPKCPGALKNGVIVTAFSGQKEELERYKKPLKTAENAGIRKSVSMGAAAGFMNFVIFASFGLAFWYGAKLVVEDEYTGRV